MRDTLNLVRGGSEDSINCGNFDCSPSERPRIPDHDQAISRHMPVDIESWNNLGSVFSHRAWNLESLEGLTLKPLNHEQIVMSLAIYPAALPAQPAQLPRFWGAWLVGQAGLLGNWQVGGLKGAYIATLPCLTSDARFQVLCFARPHCGTCVLLSNYLDLIETEAVYSKMLISKQ